MMLRELLLEQKKSLGTISTCAERKYEMFLNKIRELKLSISIDFNSLTIESCNSSSDLSPIGIIDSAFSNRIINRT